MVDGGKTKQKQSKTSGNKEKPNIRKSL